MKTLISGLLCCIAVIQVRPAAAQAITRPCKSQMNQATACIRAPRDGATLTRSNVEVTLRSASVSIAAVAKAKQGGAHFHLFLDVDASLTGDPIPASAPGVTHLGGGQKEFVLEGVPNGRHRLIVVLADNAHVPVPRQKSDTVYFVVEAH